MTVKTTGVILKISQTAPGNRLLYILTPEYGRIQAFDSRRGGRAGDLDLFTYGEFLLYQRRDSYNLNHVTVLNSFYEIRKDMKAFALASYLSQLALYASQDETIVVPQLCSLVLNAFYLLTKEDKPIDKVKAVMEWKTAQFCGFLPTLSTCEHVDFNKPVFFSVVDGSLCCDKCYTCGPTQNVSAGIAKAIHHILSNDDAGVFRFQLPADKMATLSTISETYLMYHSGQTFSSLDFYKTVG